MIIYIEMGNQEELIGVTCSEHNFWGSIVPAVNNRYGKNTVKIMDVNNPTEVELKTNASFEWIVELATNIQ